MSEEREIGLNDSDPQKIVQKVDNNALIKQSSPDFSDSVKDLTDANDLLEEILRKGESELIPWETMKLPSEGFYYDNAIPNGIIKIRAMGIEAEKILATSRLAQSGQSIDYLFNHCCEFPNDFDPLNLLTGDRMFMLYVLRGITHGNIYEFMVTCPNKDCKLSSTHQYDLNMLSETIQGPDPSLGKEPFRVSLPYISKVMGKDVWVNVRFLRGKDITSMATRDKFNKRAVPAAPRTERQVRNEVNAGSSIDQTITDNLSMVIESVMGVQNKMKIEQFINKLHSSDTSTIREFIKDKSPGIDSMVIVTCPNCRLENRMELPITEGFFRPAKS